jgi:hypothetical protein
MAKTREIYNFIQEIGQAKFDNGGPAWLHLSC